MAAYRLRQPPCSCYTRLANVAMAFVTQTEALAKTAPVALSSPKGMLESAPGSVLLEVAKCRCRRRTDSAKRSWQHNDGVHAALEHADLDAAHRAVNASSTPGSSEDTTWQMADGHTRSCDKHGFIVEGVLWCVDEMASYYATRFPSQDPQGILPSPAERDALYSTNPHFERAGTGVMCTLFAQRFNGPRLTCSALPNSDLAPVKPHHTSTGSSNNSAFFATSPGVPK